MSSRGSRKPPGTIPDSRWPSKGVEQDQDVSDDDRFEDAAEDPYAAPDEPPKKHGRRHGHDSDDHNDFMQPHVDTLRVQCGPTLRTLQQLSEKPSHSSRDMNELIANTSLKLEEAIAGRKDFETISKLSLFVIVAMLLKQKPDLSLANLVDGEGRPRSQLINQTIKLVKKNGLETLSNSTTALPNSYGSISSTVLDRTSGSLASQLPQRRNKAEAQRRASAVDVETPQEPILTYPSPRLSNTTIQPSTDLDNVNQSKPTREKTLQQSSFEQYNPRQSKPNSKPRPGSERAYEHSPARSDRARPQAQSRSHEQLYEEDSNDRFSDDRSALHRPSAQPESNYTYKTDTFPSQGSQTEPRTKPEQVVKKSPAERNPSAARIRPDTYPAEIEIDDTSNDMPTALREVRPPVDASKRHLSKTEKVDTSRGRR